MKRTFIGKELRTLQNKLTTEKESESLMKRPEGVQDANIIKNINEGGAQKKSTTEKSSEKLFVEKTSEKLFVEKTSEKLFVEKTSEKLFNEKTSENTGGISFVKLYTEKMQGEKSSEKLHVEKSSEKSNMEKSSEKLHLEKTSEKLLSEKVADVQENYLRNMEYMKQVNDYINGNDTDRLL